MSNPAIVYYVAASLDGFIADSQGGVDWLSTFDSESGAGGYTEFYACIDGLVMGSRTYEQILGFGEWPYPGKPCWVCSRRQLTGIRPEVRITSLKPEELIAEIQKVNLSRIWLVGGGQLASAFRAKQLISEYVITVVPIILGSGISMFSASGSCERLKLSDTKQFSNGFVSLTYASNISSQD